MKRALRSIQREVSNISTNEKDSTKKGSILPLNRIVGSGTQSRHRKVLFLLVTGVLCLIQFTNIGHNFAIPKEDLPSSYLLDCREILTREAYEPKHLFARTSTQPSFQMSIHDPGVDIYVSKKIKINGCWECNYIFEMLGHLNQYQDSYFLDVGGNIGMWSMAAAAANKDTFIIEPSPVNYGRICETVNQNNFHDKVNLWTMAATNTPASFGMNVPSDNKGGAHVTEVNADDNNQGDHIVKGFPIDSLNLPTKRPVAIKLDVEGHELQALTGAKKYLQEADIIYVMLELRGKIIQQDPEEWSQIFDIFSSKGLVPIMKSPQIELDPKNLDEWKHPDQSHFDVTWIKKRPKRPVQ